MYARVSLLTVFFFFFLQEFHKMIYKIVAPLAPTSSRGQQRCLDPPWCKLPSRSCLSTSRKSTPTSCIPSIGGCLCVPSESEPQNGLTLCFEQYESTMLSWPHLWHDTLRKKVSASWNTYWSESRLCSQWHALSHRKPRAL